MEQMVFLFGTEKMIKMSRNISGKVKASEKQQDQEIMNKKLTYKEKNSPDEHKTNQFF